MLKIDSRYYTAVRKTQIAIFKESEIPKNSVEKLINLFSPEVISDYLGLKYVEQDEIISEDPGYKTAGLLCRSSKTILISKSFPLVQRRLTGMHEVMHWMLHQHVGANKLHRDRPIDHTPNQKNVDYVEWEATHVACLYLMPEKLVKRVFSEVFELPIGTALPIDEKLAFFLRVDIERLAKMGELERAIAVATANNIGQPIVPLHDLFKVSPTAMAIRLLELNLLDVPKHRGTPILKLIR